MDMGGHVTCPECESTMRIVDWDDNCFDKWERGNYMDRPSFRLRVLFACQNKNCAEDAETWRREEAEEEERQRLRREAMQDEP
mgnify:CR=1 FL=1